MFAQYEENCADGNDGGNDSGEYDDEVDKGIDGEMRAAFIDEQEEAKGFEVV